VQITRLRRKLEKDPKFPRYLQTIRGLGYVLKADA
jgi:two-component system phosphate regulon response regulator OmpR